MIIKSGGNYRTDGNGDDAGCYDCDSDQSERMLDADDFSAERCKYFFSVYRQSLFAEFSLFFQSSAIKISSDESRAEIKEGNTNYSTNGNNNERFPK